MRTGESDQHYALKLAGFQWAWNHGYKMIVAEHALGALGEMDVYAVKMKPAIRAAVIEAKASRADFLNDFQDPVKMEERRAARVEQREKLADEYHQARLNERAAPTSILRAQWADRANALYVQRRRGGLHPVDVRGEFGVNALMSGYASAYYVITYPGVVGEGEAPGWGVIHLESSGPIVVRKSPRYTVSPEVIVSRLEDVARRATLNCLNLLDTQWRRKKITAIGDQRRCAPESFSSPAAPEPARTPLLPS